MEKYFGNAYRGDPGVPHVGGSNFVNIWIGSFAFSALTWNHPYIWQLSNQFKNALPSSGAQNRAPDPGTAPLEEVAATKVQPLLFEGTGSAIAAKLGVDIGGDEFRMTDNAQVRRNYWGGKSLFGTN